MFSNLSHNRNKPLFSRYAAERSLYFVVFDPPLVPDLHPEVEQPVSLLRMRLFLHLGRQRDKRRRKPEIIVEKTIYICNKVGQKEKNKHLQSQ